jgi:hypothetical protein
VKSLRAFGARVHAEDLRSNGGVQE